MANHQYNMEFGGGIRIGGGAYCQPSVQVVALPVYPDPNSIAFERPLIIPPPPFTYPYYLHPNLFSPANSWNMTPPAPTPSPANQDRSSYEYRRQTHYNVSVSIASGPHAMYGQTQRQINNTHDVPSNGITDHQFPTNVQEISRSPERTRNAAAADEGAEAILRSDVNNVLHRVSGLTENAISNHLKTRKCTHQDPSSSNICVICQDDICLQKNDEELIAILDCGHEFHADCIKRWLEQKNICPLCKAKALPLPPPLHRFRPPPHLQLPLPRPQAPPHLSRPLASVLTVSTNRRIPIHPSYMI